ncbi:mutS protein homolog 5 [Cephus cinctus]|uniref:MutS protein homolog 5 n=1 Tax=Cephus cinctus TaxID=211228 RepID=A0AAJ7R7Z7_CEPCN|nr:mutS protein homolog 5 [Cephus cinctus]
MEKKRILNTNSSSGPKTSSSNLETDEFQGDTSALIGLFEAILSEDSSEEEECAGNSKEEIQKKDVTRNQNVTDKTSFTSNEDGNEIILAMIYQKNHLGAAYYDVITSELFVMEDITDDNPDFNIAKTLYRQCQPRYVVTLMGVSDNFVNVVKRLIVTHNMDEQQEASSQASSEISRSSQVVLKIMPRKENNYEICRSRVHCLRLVCETSDVTNDERIIFLNSVLNFKCLVMIHALGLLLRYLDMHWGGLALKSETNAQYLHINYISLKDAVMIDDDTYNALQVVQPRYHPSLFKFGNYLQSQEGLSLYSILNRCKSRSGVRYLWKLLRHPTRNIDTLNERFNLIDYCLKSNNQDIIENLKSCLRHVYPMGKVILDRQSAPKATASDWNKLYKTISNVICIGEICGNIQSKSTLFAKIANGITNEMHNLKYFIKYVVDFDGVKQKNKFSVNPGVDPKLDELNHQRSNLPRLLTLIGEKDMKTLPKSVLGCRMIYVPDICYVLAITEWISSPPEDHEVPGLEFKFMVNGIRHYKSSGARELDDTVGDIFLKIINRESQIMSKLVRYINKHVSPVIKVIEYCAELDTLLSFAMVAQDFNYVRPKMVETPILSIKQGRHPLMERLVTFLPNDTESREDSSRVKILTGPNSSGKTIYLKQVALIVFMAHIGCYVPAESATIGTVTHLLTRILSIESTALNASSFLIDLRQINMALRSSTCNSLVIMDEFGKGTLETDGLALLASVLSNFIERGSNCPHIFAATHIHRVVDFVPQCPLVEKQTFEYVVNEDGSLVFLYRVIPGTATCSFAHSVAKSAGLEREVVERALEVYKCKKTGILATSESERWQQHCWRELNKYLKTYDGNFNKEKLKILMKQLMSRREILPTPMK